MNSAPLDLHKPILKRRLEAPLKPLWRLGPRTHTLKNGARLCAQVPSSKFQVPKKFQVPNSKWEPTCYMASIWSLGFGISLELGTWNFSPGFGTWNLELSSAILHRDLYGIGTPTISISSH